MLCRKPSTIAPDAPQPGIKQRKGSGTVVRPYDPAGNRTKLVTTNPTTADSPVTIASTYSADNQVAQAVRTSPIDPTQTTTYAEDGNGSLTQAANSATGTTTYAYDFERRLTTVGLPNGTAAQFAYDPDGLRARKTGTSGAVTNYVLNDLQVLLEKGSTGAAQVRYVPGIARIASGTAGYYLEDRLGSVVGLADGGGNVTGTFRYDAWGNLLQQQGATNPAYQWVGELGYYLNSDADLYLLGHRYYAPGTGRFLTRDPIGFSGGINLYGYVGNNPINSTDPSGLWLPVAIALACVGCAACAGPGVGTCLAISPDVKAFVDCMNVFIGGLPTWHQCLCGATCATCIAAAVAAGVKPIPPIRF